MCYCCHTILTQRFCIMTMGKLWGMFFLSWWKPAVIMTKLRDLKKSFISDSNAFFERKKKKKKKKNIYIYIYIFPLWSSKLYFFWSGSSFLLACRNNIYYCRPVTTKYSYLLMCMLSGIQRTSDFFPETINPMRRGQRLSECVFSF